VYRAVVAVVVVLSIATLLAACSNDSPASSASAACPLLAQLGKTGQTVAQADVSDPASFDRTLRAATTQYVATARRLRAAVPGGLRRDVDRLIAAVQQRRFADATSARAHLDDYAHVACKT
jgi:hypothetical protein